MTIGVVIFIAEGLRSVYRVSARFIFNDWCTGIPGLNSVICHESYIYHIFIAGGERLVYRDSILSWIFFYCRRQTIGVPGLNSVMNHIFFIAGGKRLVYRDSILSWIIFFLLQEANDWCTGTQFCHESYFFYSGRKTIGVPGLNSVMNHIFIAWGWRLVYRDSILSWIIFF